MVSPPPVRSSVIAATCTVSHEGFDKPDGTPGRIALLRESVACAALRGVRFACFPGGFLFARTESEVSILRKKVEEVSIEMNVIIAVGIDAAKKSTSKLHGHHVLSRLVREYRLPWFSVCAYPDGSSDLWRQRSINSEDQCDATEHTCSESRLVRGLTPQAEILMCGEIFNERIRRAIILRGTKVVVDLGHFSRGFRVHAAMKILASRGVTCLCSVHANARNATKYCYVPKPNGYEARSTPASDLIIGHKPCVEMKIWNLPEIGRLHRNV